MRAKPKFVHAYRSKGRVRFYFRRGSVNVRLPDDQGSAEFWTAYAALLDQHGPTPRQGRPSGPRKGSIGELCHLFRESPEWARLRPKTREGYEATIEALRPVAEFQADKLQRKHVLRIRDRIATTSPSTADRFVTQTRRLFEFAMDREHGGVRSNPAASIKAIHEGKSHERWTDEQHATFEQSAAPTSYRTAYMLGTYTGQRLGDCLAMRRSQYDGHGIEIAAQQKTGAALWIPAHTRLKEYLDDLDHDEETFVVSARGTPYTQGSFSTLFRRYLDGIGLHGLTFHGLRHSTGARLAEAGCTMSEIQSILGHKSLARAQIYTTAADQRTRAKAAIEKLERRSRK